jgi:DNA-binding response OmpR family regulator
MPETILIVDDDIDIVEQVSYVVTSLGHTVVTAFNRQEAEVLLVTTTVDLAIIDMMMEDRHSGCLLCRHIKRFYPETIVIILSSLTNLSELAMPTDPAHFHTMMLCDAFVHKPVHPQQLKSLVSRLLDPPDGAGQQTIPDQL